MRLPAAGGSLRAPFCSRAAGASTVPPSPSALDPDAPDAPNAPHAPGSFAAPAATPWTQELLRLVRHRFWLKFLGISGFMWLFFVAYFHVLRNPARPVMDMPLTWVDQWVSFQPWAFWAYASLWVYVGIPAGAAPDLRSLIRHGAWAAALCAAGLACFYFWPTAVPAAGLAVGSAEHAGFAVLQGLDAPGNACPSLHVATALFAAAWNHRLLADLGAARWAYALNALWAGLIVYSTLAIKQHVFLDVVGGTLLAAVFAVLSLRFTAPGGHRPGR